MFPKCALLNFFCCCLVVLIFTRTSNATTIGTATAPAAESPLAISPSQQAGFVDALLDFRSHISSDPLHALLTWNATSAPADLCHSWAGVRCVPASAHDQAQVLQFLELNLSGLSLSGSISPSAVLSLNVSLASLDLSFNSFSGVIPSSLALCSSLSYLDLSHNQFSGSVPPFLSTAVTYLDVSYNSLSGGIPPSLANCSSLTFLRLSENFLKGGLPGLILSSLPQLQVFRAAFNNLTGLTPTSLFSSPSLVQLNLLGNDLTGAFPAALGNCSSLEWIDLSYNSLAGSIPSTVGKLDKLEYIAVISSGLNGRVPSEMGNCSALEVLNLQNNEIGGEIPEALGQLQNLGWLALWQNNLSGSVPSTLGNCSAMNFLDLSENLFAGPAGLPASLGNLQNMTVSCNRSGLRGENSSHPGQLLAALHFGSLFESAGRRHTGLAGEAAKPGLSLAVQQPAQRTSPCLYWQLFSSQRYGSL